MFKDGKVGLVTGIATGVGLIVATNCLLTLCQGVGAAGQGIIIPMIIVCVLNIFAGMSFAELNSMIPSTGSISSYTLTAMGPLVTIIAVGGGYIVCQIFAATAEAALLGFVIHSVFLPGIPAIAISVVAVLIVYIVNIAGIKSYALTQIIVTLFLVGSMILLGLLGVTGVNSGTPIVQETTAFNPLGWGVLGLAPLAFWLFIGCEFITPLSKDLRNPKRDVPLAMILSLVLLLVVDSILVFAVHKYVPVDTLNLSTQPHVDFAQLILGNRGLYWMGLISLCAAASTLNTTYSAISRICYGMAKGGLLPSVFGKLNRRKAPVWGLTILGILFSVMLLTGISDGEDIQYLILTGCLFWMMAYVIAHIDVLILRKKYPTLERSFKCFGGGSVQIVGIVGMLIMMFNISPDPDMRNRIYSISIIWFAGLVVYSVVWVKLKMKSGLFKTVPIKEILNKEIEY